MSKKETAHNLIDSFEESQLDRVVIILESLKSLTDEKEDMDFCNKLYNDYLKDTDSDKHDAISIQDFAKELGIDL